jgi:hypothetical protein
LASKPSANPLTRPICLYTIGNAEASRQGFVVVSTALQGKYSAEALQQ